MTALRGDDSTGIAAVDGGFNTRLFKATIPSYDFVNTKGFHQLVNPSDRVIIGHCRKATQGKINYDNAHPFEFKSLVGCHNGTLSRSSKNALPGNTHFDTDSESIFHAFEDIGYDETLKLMFGAWALTWYDKTYKRLNFLRNHQRPLFYAFSENRQKIFWASEIPMLHAALLRNAIKYDKVYEVPANTVLSWEIPKGSGVFEAPEREKLEGRKDDFFRISPTYESGSTSSSEFEYGQVSAGYGAPPFNWDPKRQNGYYCNNRKRWIPFDEALKERAEERKAIAQAGTTSTAVSTTVLIPPNPNIPHRKECICPRCKPIVIPVSTTAVPTTVGERLFGGKTPEELREEFAQTIENQTDTILEQAREITEKVNETHEKNEAHEVISLADRVRENRKQKHRHIHAHDNKKNRQLTYIDEHGDKLSKKQFEDRTVEGCNWCGDDISWQDPCVFYLGQVYCIDHLDDVDENVAAMLKQGGRIIK
jgi:predicted glutamine amidotransferase